MLQQMCPHAAPNIFLETATYRANPNEISGRIAKRIHKEEEPVLVAFIIREGANLHIIRIYETIGQQRPSQISEDSGETRDNG